MNNLLTKIEIYDILYTKEEWNMKKIVCVISLVCIISAIFAGCSLSNNESDKYCDQEFISDFSKGLKERWDYSEENENNDKVDELEYFRTCVNTELDVIAGYTDKKFEDSELQEMAISYINTLKEQKAAFEYYNADIIKFNELYDAAYSKRNQILLKIVEKYNITFEKKYQDIVDELISRAKIANEDDKFKEQTDKITQSIEFKLKNDDYGYKTYEGIIENTTDKAFASVSISINLLDKDGVIISTEYAYVENVAVGKKAKVDFMTDKSFASYEVTAEYYTQ